MKTNNEEYTDVMVRKLVYIAVEWECEWGIYVNRSRSVADKQKLVKHTHTQQFIFGITSFRLS